MLYQTCVCDKCGEVLADQDRVKFTASIPAKVSKSQLPERLDLCAGCFEGVFSWIVNQPSENWIPYLPEDDEQL